MAAPGRRLWDLAIAAQEWGPLHAPAARLNHPPDLDGVRRSGILTRAYGLDAQEAEAFVGVVLQEREQQLRHVREEAAAGREPWASFWPGTDGEGRAAADDAWLQAQRGALVRTVAQR